MNLCPKCGYEEKVILCEFDGCTNEAEFEGWYRVFDFTGRPINAIKVRACKDCVKYLIGYSEEAVKMLEEDDE